MTAVLKTTVRPSVFVLLTGRFAPKVLWMSHGPSPFAAANVGLKIVCSVPLGRLPVGNEPP